MYESLGRREITPCDAPASHVYRRPPEPVFFPDHEEMPETNHHLELRTALYLILKRELAARATLGSDQFVYYDPRTAKKCLAPDAFVKLGSPHRPFRLWKTWELGAPDLGVEIVSASDESEALWKEKLARYRAAGVRELVRFDQDAAAQPIRVWDAVGGDLVERSPEDPRLCACETLGLFWTVVRDPLVGPMLRLARDREGTELLLMPDEAEAQEREAAAREREAAAREREANEKLRAELHELRGALERSDADGKRPKRRAKGV